MLRRVFRGWGRSTPDRMGWPAAGFVLAAILALGIPLTRARLALVEGNRDIGHADAPAYALQARSLATGRGLRIPYVTGFFHPYDPEIWRTDDHWPPFLAFVLAPVFRVHGADAEKARMTMVAIGSLALPLAAAGLAGAATGKAWAALLGALAMVLSNRLLRESTVVLSDIATMALVCAFAACVLMSTRRRGWLVAAGLVGALAYYAKGSQAMLLGLLPLLALLLHGPRILVHRSLLGGILAFLLAVFPRWQANARTFGNPLHSTQNYVTTFFGLGNADHTWSAWDQRFYAVHWGRNLPRLSDRFRDRDRLEASLGRNAEEYARLVLLGPDASAAAWPRLGRAGPALHGVLRGTGPPAEGGEAWLTPQAWPAWWFTAVHGAGLLWGLALAPLVAVGRVLGRAVRRLRRRRAQRAAPEAAPAVAEPEAPTQSALPEKAEAAASAGPAPPVRPRLPTRLRVTAVLLTLILAQAGFVIALWEALPRLTLPLLPLAWTLGMVALAVVVDGLSWPLRWAAFRCAPARLRPAAGYLRSALVGLLCAGVWMAGRAPMQRLTERQIAQVGPASVQPRSAAVRRMGAWIGEHLPPDAVIMSRYPWQILFYSPDTVRGVGLPYATPDVIFAIARYYGVTHFIADRDRPGLRRFLRRRHPALSRVRGAPFPVYAIDYERFQSGELADLRTVEPLR